MSLVAKESDPSGVASGCKALLVVLFAMTALFSLVRLAMGIEVWNALIYFAVGLAGLWTVGVYSDLKKFVVDIARKKRGAKIT